MSTSPVTVYSVPSMAAFYGETTKRFNQQVNRNLARFPEDFMFQLNDDEYDSLMLQFATLKTGRGRHRKYLPHVFTEHGAIMNLATSKSVLGDAFKHSNASLGSKDAQELLALQIGLLQPMAEKTAAYSQNLYTIASGYVG